MPAPAQIIIATLLDNHREPALCIFTMSRTTLLLASLDPKCRYQHDRKCTVRDTTVRLSPAVESEVKFFHSFPGHRQSQETRTHSAV